MENSPKALPGALDLIKETWKLFTSTWNTSFKTSRVLIYVGLASLIAGLLAHLNPLFVPLIILVMLGSFVFITWITIRVIMVMLSLEAGLQPVAENDAGQKAWSMFWSYIWVSILTGLVVFAGFILFILPGIYFAIALGFSDLILVDQNTRGTQALAASRALVKGRWWATFGRLLAGGIVFGLLFGLATSLVTSIIESIAGSAAAEANMQNPLLYGIFQLVQMTLLAAFLPLMIGFEVKVYRALQKTR